MRLIIAILLFSTGAKAQQPVVFYTKDSDIVTIKGVDTLIDFAGNFKITGNKQYTKVKHPNAQYNSTERFWTDLVIEKLSIYYTRTKNSHKVK